MTPAARRLLSVFRDLSPERAETLLEFAEFLKQKQVQETPVIDQPVVTERPANESVVKAIKRLSASYPMLDKAKLFNETSSLMTSHVMHGRPAVEVIDELEALFRRTYEQMLLETREP